MGTFLGLFATSLIVGFALGRFSWHAIAISSAALAALAAAALQRHGFEMLPGIAAIAACLAIHQVAYLARMWFVDHSSEALVPAVAGADERLQGCDQGSHPAAMVMSRPGNAGRGEALSKSCTVRSNALTRNLPAPLTLDVG
jgi:hypothetical protein